MKGEGGQRLVALDGIRGVAALVVLLFHLDLPITPQFDRGYLMVDLFFMLSGFVLTLAVEPRLRGGWSWWRFMLARYRRLLPVVLAGVVIGAVIYWQMNDPYWSNGAWALRLMMAALLIPIVWTRFDPALFPLNRAHWSLFFELLANLLHCLLLWRLSTRALAFCVAVLAMAYALSVHQIGGSTAGAFQGQWHMGLPRVFFAYTAGMLLARLWQNGRLQHPVPPYAGPLLAPLAVLVVAPLPVWLGDALAVMFLFPAVIWIGAISQPAGLLARVMLMLGAISYPLYAVHGPIVRSARELGGGLVSQGAAALLSIAIAIVLAYTLERARTRRRLRGETKANAPA